MRKKIEWIFLTQLKSEIELDYFLKQFPSAPTKKSNMNPCTLCFDNTDCHKMRASYQFCECSTECPTRYLTMKCQKSGTITVKGINLHQPSENIPKEQLKKQNGISPKFKQIIDELLYRNISRPYKIYQEIILNNYLDHARPSLLQIQNYLKYYRKKKW